MEYRVEENVQYTVYPYEHPFDDAWKTELGCGKHYYVYRDDEPFLMIQAPGERFTEAVIYHDSLVIGSFDHGIYIVNLKDVKDRTDFRIRNIEIDGYFGYFVLDRDILYVLGMRNVYAFNRDFRLLWKSGPLSTDGVVPESITDQTMVLSCNDDPMGAWFTREISLADGKVLK